MTDSGFDVEDEISRELHSSLAGENFVDRYAAKPRDVPLPLRRKESRAEEFPVDALGNVMGEAAKRIHEITQAPLALCAQSVLAAANLAVQGHADISFDGRNFPVSENFLTIAESGERKSATDRAALAAARFHQRNLQDRYRLDFAEFEIERDSYIREREKILKKKGLSLVDRADGLRALGASPSAPILPFLTVEEPTYEGLFKALLLGQASMGIFSDEGGRLIGGHGMSEDNLLKMLTGLSELWDGNKTISRVRAEEGATCIQGKRLAMHLMMQPVVAAKIFGNPFFSGQGFLARCLISWPQSRIGHRPYQSLDIQSDPSVQLLQSRLLEIHGAQLPLASEMRNELAPPFLRVPHDSRMEWTDFYKKTEEGLKENGRYRHVRGFGSKAPEHALRLSGTISLFDDLGNREISVESTCRGVALAQFYLDEQLRVAHDSSDAPDLQLAEKLLAWLQAQPSPLFHLAQVYQYGPSGIRDKKTAKKAIQVLEEHRWVSASGEREIGGICRKETWLLKKPN